MRSVFKLIEDLHFVMLGSTSNNTNISDDSNSRHNSNIETDSNNCNFSNMSRYSNKGNH